MDYIIQISGFLAFLTTTSSYALKSDWILKRVNFAGTALWGLHMASMQEWASFTMLVLAIVMIGASILGKEVWSKRAWWVNIALIPLAALGAMIGFVEGAALLPLLGGFFINTGVARCTGWRLTLMVMVGEVMWLANGFAIGSVFTIFHNSIGLAVLTYRLWASKPVPDHVTAVNG